MGTFAIGGLTGRVANPVIVTHYRRKLIPNGFVLPNCRFLLLYLLAIIFPPGAVLVRGRIFQAWLNAVLWAIAIVSILVGIGVYAGPLSVAHALFAVYWYDEKRKTEP